MMTALREKVPMTHVKILSVTGIGMDMHFIAMMMLLAYKLKNKSTSD